MFFSLVGCSNKEEVVEDNDDVSIKYNTGDFDEFDENDELSTDDDIEGYFADDDYEDYDDSDNETDDE